MVTNVLVVEDNPPMRRLLMSILAELDVVGHECADGVEALSAYRRIHPDIVLMDIELPRRDGLTATRCIRAADPKARIVIITHLSGERFREAAKQAGAVAFLEKENLSALPALLNRELETNS